MHLCGNQRDDNDLIEYSFLLLQAKINQSEVANMHMLKCKELGNIFHSSLRLYISHHLENVRSGIYLGYKICIIYTGPS